MKFKKVLCGVTAALTVLSATAIPVQAAELKLLTAKFSEVSNGGYFDFFGNGYFSDGTKILRLGEKEIAEWNKTGKIAVSSVTTDFDVSGLDWWTGDFEGGYVQFVKEDDSENITERYIVHLDENSGKIETVYTLGSEWAYTMSDGYTVLEPKGDVNSGTVSVTVIKPDGTRLTSTIKSWLAHMDGAAWDDYVWFNFRAVEDEKYCCYIVVDEKEGGSILDERIYAVYAIDRQGNAVKVAGDLKASSCGGIETAQNKNLIISLMGEDYVPYGLALSAAGGNARKFDFYGSAYYIGDNRAIVVNMGSSNYELVDINTGKTIVSYPYIDSMDDALFRIYTNEGKFGFIDRNGKILDTFDDADIFRGDYAPVLKDGKAYLIDRNMNCVSDKIDANAVYSFMGGLYRVDNGASMIVAYINADTSSEPSSAPSESKPDNTSGTPSGSTSSDNTSSSIPSESTPANPGDNDNPNSGAAMALIPIALVGGAAVVVTKKRRK